jgi:hypothetical protein
MNLSENILIQLKKNGDLSVKSLTDLLLVSKQAVHYSLNKLLEQEKIIKLGTVPKTIYRLKPFVEIVEEIPNSINEQDLQFLESNFLLITEIGKMLSGLEGFSHWCKQRKLPLEKTVDEYIKTKKRYDGYYNELQIIDGLEKLENTKGYDHIFLDSLLYLDFYAIERFGKTRLGTLLHYAKQGQNKYLMNILVKEINAKIESLIAKYKFDAIGFVPPTIRREVQLMKYLETQLKINLPKIRIQKISGIIPVPQKSLNKIEERISNAENTFSIPETIKYKHILLLDDAVGSGSTLNQIAGKIKQKGIAKKITGLALVGSFKGFDVITDI